MAATTTLLLSAAGTLVAGLSYVLVKRFARSNCHTHTSLCDCDSPAVEMQKKQTERMTELEEIIKTLQKNINPDRDNQVGLATGEF